MRALYNTKALQNALKSHPTARFSDACEIAIPTTKTAGIDASGVAPAPGCTLTTPHGQPAPVAALSKLSCE